MLILDFVLDFVHQKRKSTLPIELSVWNVERVDNVDGIFRDRHAHGTLTA